MLFFLIKSNIKPTWSVRVGLFRHFKEGNMKEKIEISKDIFDVSHRLKKIDRDYCLVYDRDKKVYEVYIGNLFCFKIGKNLDNLALKKAYLTHIRNKKKLLEKIEQDNMLLRQKELEQVKNKAKFDLKNMIDFASKTGKNENFSNINLTKWF